MEPTERIQTRPDGTTFTPKDVDGLERLRQWRLEDPDQYQYILDNYVKQENNSSSEDDT